MWVWICVLEVMFSMTKTEEIKISDFKDCTSAFEEALTKTVEGKYVLRPMLQGWAKNLCRR